MPEIPAPWKRAMARLVRWPIVHRLMVLGIRVVVPRHRIGAALVVLNEDRHVLLLRHVFHPSVPWGLPGGWLARHETPEACALRELREETGLTATLGPIVHLAYEPRPDHLSVAYLAHAVPGPIKLSPEILEAAWFAPEAMPTPLFPFVRDAIRAALRAPVGADGIVTERRVIRG